MMSCMYMYNKYAYLIMILCKMYGMYGSYDTHLTKSLQPVRSLSHKQDFHVPNLSLKQPKDTYSVQKYISNNSISPVILYIIIQNCCRCIMVYHNIMNRYHSNATLHNFYMYDNYECVLTYDVMQNKELNRASRYKDYAIFFDSCKKEVSQKNKHFMHFYELYKKSLLKSLF